MEPVPQNDSALTRKHLFVMAGFAVFALCVAVAIVFAFSEGSHATDDAYVTGHVHLISPRVNGTVERVVVDDNQLVHAGQVLVELDPRDFDVRVALERARILQAQAAQHGAQAAIAEAQAAVVATQADAHKANLDYERAKSLVTGTPRALSQQEFDSADAAWVAARSHVDAANARLVAARAALFAAQAQEAQGTANLRDASLQREYASIVAPVDGYVGRKTVESGQRVTPGQPLLAIVEPAVWVVANYRETQLKHIAAGDAATVTVDAEPGVTLHGRVDSLAPATGAQFALLPPDNATGNFTKVVQRVPVKIVFDQPLAVRLAPGLSVHATILPAEHAR
ncbi:HlyD family secretion protein [Paraburkholderia bannensis]|uniref:HlyD family secretion protein n=1 Tax=Paraburkholderia bannensis TaxID=765414 RepID=UPI002AB5EE34|nr:HlyD family secretion protein [Paraburkholderia bannensis]